MLSGKVGACQAGGARESVFSPGEGKAYGGILIKAAAAGLRRALMICTELRLEKAVMLYQCFPFSTDTCQKCSNFIRGEESF